MMIEFVDLLKKLRPEDWEPPDTLLAVDPGETTGWALFRMGNPTDSGEIPKEDFADTFLGALMTLEPSIVVVEDYKIYPHKAKAHTWSSLHTVKIIGVIEALCAQNNIPVVKQMASSKQFVTNEKLRAWEFYQKRRSHTNDAIRHGCYYLLFHKG